MSGVESTKSESESESSRTTPRRLAIAAAVLALPASLTACAVSTPAAAPHSADARVGQIDCHGAELADQPDVSRPLDEKLLEKTGLNLCQTFNIAVANAVTSYQGEDPISAKRLQTKLLPYNSDMVQLVTVKKTTNKSESTITYVDFASTDGQPDLSQPLRVETVTSQTAPNTNANSPVNSYYITYEDSKTFGMSVDTQFPADKVLNVTTSNVASAETSHQRNVVLGQLLSGQLDTIGLLQTVVPPVAE